jgi:hypothetical protein
VVGAIEEDYSPKIACLARFLTTSNEYSWNRVVGLTNLIAVIIESRPLRNIGQVIDNHMKNLPVGTPLWGFGHPDNFMCSPYLRYWNEIRITSPQDYNEVLTSPSFWEKFLSFERVLIFQHDSEILRPGIEEFLSTDIGYYGASWIWEPRYPGNGGLSLRDPKTMLEVCTHFPWDGMNNEDVWICKHMYEHEIGRLATVEEADKFSIEEKFILGSFGAHAIDRWLSAEETRIIRSQYGK